MAAPGYVVVMINPRGSFGYGQKFTAEISRDWGGKVYDDLMKGLDAAIAKYPFIDSTRLAAAGGSYGGYMTDWIATHYRPLQMPDQPRGPLRPVQHERDGRTVVHGLGIRRYALVES